MRKQIISELVVFVVALLGIVAYETYFEVAIEQWIKMAIMLTPLVATWFLGSLILIRNEGDRF